MRYWRAKVAHLHLPDGSVLLLAKPVRLLAAQSAVYIPTCKLGRHLG